MLRFIAQGELQFLKTSRPGKVYLIQLCQGIVLQKLPVGLSFLRGIVAGKDPNDISRYGARAEILQHAYPFIALLHIKMAHKLIAGNGVANSLIPQMSLAQVPPFYAELAVRGKQRHKI